MFRRVYDAEPREYVRRSEEFQDYVALTSAFLQLRQRLDALEDQDSVKEDQLRKQLPDQEAYRQIEAIQNRRSAALQTAQKELAGLARQIEQNDYYKRIKV